MIKKSIKKLYFKLTWQKLYLRPKINCPFKWYGNSYGGFYVNPAILDKSSIVYSFGIGEDISFDLAIMKHHKCKLFAFDPTPKSISWIKNQKMSPDFIFHEYGLSAISGSVDFYLPKNSNFVSGSAIIQNNVNVDQKVTVKMLSIHDIVIKLGHKQIDLLKIDIEGSEYEVIQSIARSKIPICQIVVEFHERFFKDGKAKTIEAINILRNIGFEIFAVSDTYEEVSFIHKTCLHYQQNQG